MEPLRDKIAIVTGASTGIGRDTALLLAEKGASVVAVARNEAALRSLETEVSAGRGRVIPMPVDVTDRGQQRSLVHRTIDQFGKIDVLVCNAGIYPRKAIRDSRIEDYERCMAVNFYGAVGIILDVLPHMLERKSGNIVVIASVDGKKGLPPDGIYVSTKFAITGFMDVLRQELFGTGVAASTILPGRVDTPMIAGLKVPLVSAKISSRRVASAVLRAIMKRRAEIVIPFMGPKLLIVLSSISARLGDWLVRITKLEGIEEHAYDENP